MTTTRNRMPAALAGASLGLAVFPAMRNTKHEYTADATKDKRYYWPEATRHGATTAPAIIERWWARRPHSNVKARMLRGQLCIETDPRNGGNESATRLAAAGQAFTPTYEDESPGDGITGRGVHRIYELPADITLTGVHPLAPGIEMHCEGATVMLAGSTTDKGEYISRRAIPPQPAPDWLIERIRELQARLAMTESELQQLPEMQIGPQGCTAYGQAALSSEVARIINTPKGQRNDALGRAAFRMGQLKAIGHLTHDAIANGLQQAVQMAGWKNPRKIIATIKRGIRNGERCPRRITVKAFTTTIRNTLAEYLQLLDAATFAGKWAAGKSKQGRAMHARAENVRTWLQSFLTVCDKAGRMIANYACLSASLDCHMSDRTTRNTAAAAIAAGLVCRAKHANNVHAPSWHIDARATIYMLTPIGWDAWRATICSQPSANAPCNVLPNDTHHQNAADAAPGTLSPIGNDCGSFAKKGIKGMQRAGVFMWGALGASARPVLDALAGGATTAAEIAKTKGLHPATVYRVLDKLQEMGMVQTAMQPTSGRPRKVLTLAPDAMNAKTAAAVERLYYKGRNVKERIQRRDDWINNPNPAKGRRAKFYQRIGMIESMAGDVLAQWEPFRGQHAGN
jgi:predicted transcriptional regulator